MSSLPTLVIVESPAKARTIAKYLGNNFIVEPTVGHIADLVKTKANPLGVDIDNGFKPKYSLIPDKKDKVQAIIDAAKRSKEIFIAADPDREGEAIAWHVANAIKSTKKPVKRVLFHEITKAGVKKGITTPGDLNKDLFDAQQARRVLDRLVGFLVTPYLWSAFGSNCSAGRVQSVCLRLIVDREKEIEKFVPEVYWDISAALAKPAKKTDKFVAKYPKRITDEKLAKKIKSDLDGSTYKVSNLEQKTQQRNPLPPLTTSKLQQLASSRLKFSTKKTMKAAQALYEGGHVTYIRTDSARSSPESINMVRDWLKDNKFDLPDKPNIYKSKSSAQDAHEAIRPTNVSLVPDQFVGADENKKLYRLIWEIFVASQMKPAVYDTLAVTVKASKGHFLKANGRVLIYSGWLSITQDDKQDKDVKLPPLKIGDDLILVPPKVKSEKKATQPPPRYAEGSLVKELEKRGIGRPSTYAAIIAKIANRNYVVKTKNVFSPTELGKKVINELSKYFTFMKYEYTKEMEERLDKIAEGNLEYIEMLSNFFSPFKDELQSARASLDKDGGYDCEICGKRMKLKHGKFGYFIACSGYPKCKSTKSVELDGEKITLKETTEIAKGVKCPDCNSAMAKRDGKFGPFYSCVKYPKCNGKRKVPFGKKCPKCNSELFLTFFNGQPKLACMGYPNCKNVEDPPPGTKINWIEPKKLKTKSKYSKKMEKVITK